MRTLQSICLAGTGFMMGVGTGIGFMKLYDMYKTYTVEDPGKRYSLYQLENYLHENPRMVFVTDKEIEQIDGLFKMDDRSSEIFEKNMKLIIQKYFVAWTNTDGRSVISSTDLITSPDNIYYEEKTDLIFKKNIVIVKLDSVDEIINHHKRGIHVSNKMPVAFFGGADCPMTFDC